MPALSDYTSGTITLTNGSTAFTGSGTGWQAADFREGDTILGIEDNAGVEYVIATITGNGAGTLTQEWEGATGTYQYRMRYMADGARVTAQARNLIELLGDGNLQAEAGLTGAADTLSYYTGPAAKALTPLTASARNELAGDLTARIDSKPAGDSISVVGLAGDQPHLPYMRQASTDDVLYLQRRLGFEPVEQGFSGNKIVMGWDGSNFAGTVDGSPLGKIWTDSIASSGSSWRRMPDGTLLQYASNVVITNAAGGATITLPTAFTSASSYIVVPISGDYLQPAVIGGMVTGFKTASEFGVFVQTRDTGLPFADSAVRVDWIAVGI